MTHRRFRTVARSGTWRSTRQRAAALFASGTRATVWAVQMAAVGRTNDEVKRLRWLLSSLTHSKYATKGIAYKKFPASIQRAGDKVNDAAGVKPSDAATWPAHWGATDIERLLSRVISNPENVPDCNSLALMLANRDIASLNILLSARVKSPPPREATVVDASIACKLSKELATYFDKTMGALSLIPGCDVRKIVLWPQGNMQQLKQLIYMRYLDALKCGRVIVRSCARIATVGSSWVDLVMADKALGAPETYSTDAGMCELIRAHVETVTGSPQDPAKYCDTGTAYATWMSETERCFSIPSDKKGVEPLIVLDSCDVLAQNHHKSLVHKSSGKRYTLLEALCLGVPAPHSILLSGSNVEFNSTDPVYLGLANVSVLPFDSTALRNG